MRVTERNTHVPSGLTRFLTLHEDCPRGLQIIRDQSLVTIVCHGCESSFSYLTKVAPGDPTEVERALQGLTAESSEPEEPEEQATRPRTHRPRTHRPPRSPPRGPQGSGERIRPA